MSKTCILITLRVVNGKYYYLYIWVRGTHKPCTGIGWKYGIFTSDVPCAEMFSLVRVFLVFVVYLFPRRMLFNCMCRVVFHEWTMCVSVYNVGCLLGLGCFYASLRSSLFPSVAVWYDGIKVLIKMSISCIFGRSENILRTLVTRNQCFIISWI